MKTIRVSEDLHSRIYSYCMDHGAEHDGSYLPGRDFEVSDEHPSYLLMQNEAVVGAVSLMRTKRYLSVNTGRFSIFHSVLNSVDAYARLLEAIRPHFDGLKSVYLFIPEKNKKTAAILTELGFQIERYAFILERGGSDPIEPVFPEGIHVHPLDAEDLEGIGQFVDCMNEAFSDLAGHTTSTVEDIQSHFSDQSYIDGGLCLLKKGREAIGTIALMKDLDDPRAGEILAFGLLKKYRGKDLGRNLLRYGMNFLITSQFNPLVLAVNGENHSAIKLYQSEGFFLTESVVCYNLPCDQVS